MNKKVIIGDMSKMLRYRKLIESKDNVSASYKDDVTRMKEL